MQKKIQNNRFIGLLLLLMLILFAGQAQATDNYVICRIDWISPDSAEVKIEWKRPDSQNLMITGWQMAEDRVLNIYYQISNVQGYEKRLITLAGKPFPVQVRLFNSAQPAQTQPIFSDISGSGERERAIANLYYQGILGGYPDGSFAPDKQVSRAEFAKILCEALKLPQTEKEEIVFQDIEQNWAKGYILTLAEKKLVKGKAEGIFDPDGKISLGEIFALLDRSFYLYGKAQIAANALPEHWSNPHYLAMKGQAVVKPTDDIYTNYQAGRLASRGEVALFISRILEQKHDRK